MATILIQSNAFHATWIGSHTALIVPVKFTILLCINNEEIYAKHNWCHKVTDSLANITGDLTSCEEQARNWRYSKPSRRVLQRCVRFSSVNRRAIDGQRSAFPTGRSSASRDSHIMSVLFSGTSSRNYDVVVFEEIRTNITRIKVHIIYDVYRCTHIIYANVAHLT